MSGEGSFFVDGGTLRLETPSYIERAADHTLYERVSRGELCYLLTPRRSGKSSLLIRLRERLRHEGAQVAYVDLTSLGTGAAEADWYYGLCRSIARELDLAEGLETWWAPRERLPAPQRWGEFLRDFVLGALAGRVVVMLDEIDSTRRVAFSDDFFAALRASVNARATDPELMRLTFVLAGVATPGDLIKDPTRTPFNVGFRVDLSDFTRAEAQVLVPGLAGHCPRPEEVLERILDWTNGHPYLTQRLCKAAIVHDTAPEAVDALVESELLSPAARGREDHFKFVRERVLGGERARAVIALYGRALRGQRVLEDTRLPVNEALKLTDLVGVAEGNLVPRNRILATVFDEAFVAKALRWSVPRVVAAASVLVTVATAAVFLLWVTPQRNLAAIDRAMNDAPRVEYEALKATPGWGRAADERYARFYDRQAMAAVQKGDRDRALVYALRADVLAPTDRRRAQAAALWTPDLDALERTFRLDSPITALAFDVSGERLYAGGDGEAAVWNVHSERVIMLFRDTGRTFLSVVFSRDGGRLAVSDSEEMVRVWGVPDGRLLLKPTELGAPAIALALSPEGTELLAATSKAWRRWDIETGDLTAEGAEPPARILALAYTSAGAPRALVVKGGDVAVLDLKSKKVNDLGVAMSPFSAATFGPSGDEVWIASGGGGVIGLEVKPPGNRRRAIDIDEVATGLGLSGDGLSVITASFSGFFRRWSGETGRSEPEFLQLSDTVTVFQAHPKGESLATVGGDGVARLWSLRAPAMARSAAAVASPGLLPLTVSLGGLQAAKPVSELLLDPEPKVGVLDQWAMASMKSMTAAFPHRFTRVAFSPRGDRLVVARVDAPIALFGTSASQEPTAALEAGSLVWDLAFSQDGDQLLAGNSEGKAQAWGVERSATPQAPAQHEVAVLAVALHPDRSRWLIAGSDGQAMQLDAASGKKIGPELVHANDWIRTVAYSPDGSRIATGGDDRTARLWDTATGAPVGQPMKHDSWVQTLAFSPDGQTLLIGTRDGEARLWDTTAADPKGSALKTPDSVDAVAFSRDGSHFWTVSEHLALLWPADGTAATPVGAAAFPGPLLTGSQCLLPDPQNPLRFEYAAAVNAEIHRLEVNLARPPADFTRPSAELEQELLGKFALEWRDGLLVDR